MVQTKNIQSMSRIVVTSVAGVTLLAHVLVDEFTLDPTAILLVVLALFPWLASMLSSAELPGGWKFEFNAVRIQQQKQGQEIAALKFLVAHFLTEPECRHLKGLASGGGYFAREDGTTRYFEGELRRLRALGFIDGIPGQGVRSLMQALKGAGGGKVNVAEYFETTPRGREYLRLQNDLASRPVES